jgi:hypothetical protein
MSNKPIISSPELLGPSKELKQEELLELVKKKLAPMIDKFVESHRGKEFTAKDIEDLYKNLNKNLNKIDQIYDKDEGINFKSEAEVIAQQINKEHPLKFSDRLMRGFADFCNKIGLEGIGAACLKHIESVDLTSKLDKIAGDVANKKIIGKSTRNDNEKLININKTSTKQLEH